MTPQTPQPTRIASWKQLDDLCAAPLLARFVLDGQLVELPLRRLSPAEQHRIDAVYDFSTGRSSELRPPLQANTTDKYNFEDPEYQRGLAQFRRVARALTIYAGCPLLQEAAPGLTDRQQTMDFVHGKLTDQLLDLILVTVAAGGLDLAERVNFTSPLGSAQG